MATEPERPVELVVDRGAYEWARIDAASGVLVDVVGHRLIINSYNEEKDRPVWEPQVRTLGYRIAGWDEIPHPDRRVVRRVFWLDVDA